MKVMSYYTNGTDIVPSLYDCGMLRKCWRPEVYFICPDFRMLLSPFTLNDEISDSLYKLIRFHQIGFPILTLIFIISGLTEHNYIMIKAGLGIFFFLYYPIVTIILHNAYRLELKYIIDPLHVSPLSSPVQSEIGKEDQLMPPFSESFCQDNNLPSLPNDKDELISNSEITESQYMFHDHIPDSSLDSEYFYTPTSSINPTSSSITSCESSQILQEVKTNINQARLKLETLRNN